MNIKKIIEEEFNNAHYLKWKRDNVTLRGIRDIYADDNGGMAALGQGLYTTPLSNRALARQYGDVYFLVNAKPKNPKTFNTLNDWEIWFYNTLVYNYSKKKGKEYPDRKDFDDETSISEELIKMGYDGVLIKGREMVNFKPENVLYFKNENQLIQYYEFKYGH